MKKFLIASGVTFLAFATIVGAQTQTFNSNLTVGSTGSEVVALQEVLLNAGYDIPALSSGTATKGYFGSQTKSAVMKYQAENGIPNTGFVGPLTRAALNAGGPVAGGSVVCPAGFDCTPNTPVVVNCPVGYTCIPKGSTVPPVTTIGAEGVMTTKLASSPIADSNIVISSNVPVYGIDVKAQGSDMVVDRVLLQMSVGVGTETGSPSNPATFVRTLYAYDGSTLLKSWNLSPADFNKDSSDRYYVIASGMRFVVPKDTTKTLTFAVDTSGVAADMSSRYLRIQGYAGNTQNVRAVDGAGLSNYTDMSGTSNSRLQVFATSGNSTVTATVNSALSPKSTNNKVDSTDGVKELTMQAFDLKSTTGASKVTKICASAAATTTDNLPTTLYLYDGSSRLASVSASASIGGVACFTDLTINIAKDATKTLLLKADFPKTVLNASASTTIIASGVVWEKPDSTTASSTPSAAIASNNQRFYSAAPQWKLVSATAVANGAGYSGATSSVTATMVLSAKAVGGAMTKPVLTDFDMVFASSTVANGGYVDGTTSIATTPGIQVSPSDATIGEDGTYTVTLTGTLYSNSVSASAPYFMAVRSIDSSVGGNVITDQNWGIDDFYTPAAQLTKSI